MIAIFDIDSLVYAVCYSTEDIDEAVQKFDDEIRNITISLGYHFKVSRVEYVGFCRSNYRNIIDPLYKANRKDVEKPPNFYDLIDYIKMAYDVHSRDGIETDDLVVELFNNMGGRKKCVIVSIDKDFNQVPGIKYNYKKDTYVDHSDDEAFEFLMRQMIIGDPGDNVNYIRGVGPKWCDKNLSGKSRFGMVKTVLGLFKEVYKSKGREMFIRCFLLLKMNVFELRKS